jgi:branched-chain amino acid aminotransferase
VRSSSRCFGTYFPNIDASKLTIERVKPGHERKKLPKEELKFGQTLSDHMLEVDWQEGKGWTAPRIVPVHDLQLSPAASVFHYASECFEGLKAYLDDNDKIRLFRPDKNMERMNNSLKRLRLPTFEGDELLKCIKQLLKTDKDWIPRGSGYSLYLRPTAIGTWPGLGVGPSFTSKLYVLASPVGPYYPQGFKPVKLLADTRYCRAWPGGTGGNKLGANYAPGILPQTEALKKGYAQILWLFGEELHVTEVGTMNIFFFWTRPDGKKELITAPLDGTILPGVTRDSVLSLAREWGTFEVTERPFTLHEVIKAIQENRLHEAFGAGTAAIVSPVEGFSYQDKFYAVPLDPSDPKATVGKLTNKFAETIMSIQYGKTPHKWSVVVD